MDAVHSSSDVRLDVGVESGEGDFLFPSVDRVHLILIRFPRPVLRLHTRKGVRGKVAAAV